MKTAGGGGEGMKTATPSDRCSLCGRKFDEVVFRFDQSDICTTCQHYESAQQRASRQYDRDAVLRINGRCW